MADQPGTLEKLAKEVGIALMGISAELQPQNLLALLESLGSPRPRILHLTQA